MEVLIGLGFVMFAYFAVIGFIDVWKQTAKIKNEDDITLNESTKERLRSLAGINLKSTKSVETKVEVPTKLDQKVVNELLSDSIRELDNLAQNKSKSKEKIKARKKTLDMLKETEVDPATRVVSSKDIALLAKKAKEINSK